jgi:hypothetical protein
VIQNIVNDPQSVEGTSTTIWDHLPPSWTRVGSCAFGCAQEPMCLRLCTVARKSHRQMHRHAQRESGVPGFNDSVDVRPSVMTSDPRMIDRRRQRRLPLRWTAYLYRAAATTPIEAMTRNVSSDGFYCVVEEPFAIGEVVHSALLIPAFDPEQPDRMMTIESECSVVRVECMGNGSYGVAFHMRTLEVVPAATYSRRANGCVM